MFIAPFVVHTGYGLENDSPIVNSLNTLLCLSQSYYKSWQRQMDDSTDTNTPSASRPRIKNRNKCD